MAAIKLAAASWQHVSPAEDNLGQDLSCMNTWNLFCRKLCSIRQKMAKRSSVRRMLPSPPVCGMSRTSDPGFGARSTYVRPDARSSPVRQSREVYDLSPYLTLERMFGFARLQTGTFRRRDVIPRGASSIAAIRCSGARAPNTSVSSLSLARCRAK
jgi:hypothetical protein